jgi:hypothetical protein
LKKGEQIMLDPGQVLAQNKIFAVVGASQNKESYGYEVFAALTGAGYKVYPINPKYEFIDGERCYPTLKDLQEKPEVVVTLVSPPLTEKVVETCAQLEIPFVWMPPGSWSDLALSRCHENRIQAIHDVCLVFALKSLPHAKA